MVLGSLILQMRMGFTDRELVDQAKAPTEFGAKLHLSIDETGFGRIEYLSFNAFNEGPMLIDALNAYRYRNGFYPKRVLVDKIYRTKDNIRSLQ